ncbi:hypothetical protein AMTRI_Chr13g86270 [Amborella trichopoda]
MVAPFALGTSSENNVGDRGRPLVMPLKVPPPQAELVSRVIGDHFTRFRGYLSQPPTPGCILAEAEFAAPTIIELIPIPFSTSGATVAYNVNPVADQFQRAFQSIYKYFLVRSFLRFGYEVSFEALDKCAIEILGPYGISPLPSIPLHFIVSYCTDIRGSSEWRFPCRKPDEGRPSRPIRRVGYPDPNYAFAMLLANRSSFISRVGSFYNKKSR